MSYHFEYSECESGITCNTHVDGENQSWPALTEQFLQFLRGCGFILSAQDFADYIDEKVTEYEEACDA